MHQPGVRCNRLKLVWGASLIAANYIRDMACPENNSPVLQRRCTASKARSRSDCPTTLLTAATAAMCMLERWEGGQGLWRVPQLGQGWPRLVPAGA